MVLNTNHSNNSFSKTICSICYEDLKPIIEDLQSISICGHVFHELCLQQWFEYCSGEKKCSCPVCKQSCTAKNVGRLYFQSVGDQNEPLSGDVKVGDSEQEDPDWLRGEVNRLEGKVSGLNKILERQVKEITQLNEEDQLNKEVKSRTAAMEQKLSIQQLLCSKSEELDALKLDRLRLQDRSMALAKELAALKLVSDVNLEEDDVLKLASFGNEAITKDTIDILRKSLVIRNKSYKELMAKCNQLGRGEALSCKKLEKAKEKIDKLKKRVQELEMIVEVRDNEALRTLKASKKISCKRIIDLDSTDDNSNALSTSKFSSVHQKEQLHVPLDLTGIMTDNQENFCFTNDKDANSAREFETVALGQGRNSSLTAEEAALKLSTADHTISESDSRHLTRDSVKSTLPKSEALSDVYREATMHDVANSGRPFGIKHAINNKKSNTLDCSTDEEIATLDEIREVQPILNIRKDSKSPGPLSRPGDVCFSSGLMGPDGAHRYLGRWCKRGQNKGSLAMQGTSACSGDLVAVGSDGRGGRVKMLRSMNQSPLDSKENSVCTKRYKFGAKASGLQSQGCLQIEHFFGRASQ